MALHFAEREHKLKAAAASGVVHNTMVIAVRCRGQSAVIYLLN